MLSLPLLLSMLTFSSYMLLLLAVDYICLLEDELRRYADVFEREGRTKDEFDD